MISKTDTDEICSRLEHYNHCRSTCESHASLADRPFPSCRPKRAGGVAADNRIPPRRPRGKTDWVPEVAAYMLQNLDKPVRMTALATRAGVSLSNFYYLFKRATGCTPNDFFIRMRMRRAGELFQETDLSVKEVSGALGYGDPFYFSRLFKAVSGISPREYRMMVAVTEGRRKNAVWRPPESKPLELFATSSQTAISPAKLRISGTLNPAKMIRPQVRTKQPNIKPHKNR